MGLFKQPEYRRFNPKPRYWDPEAEARKEREKRIRTELGPVSYTHLTLPTKLEV